MVYIEFLRVINDVILCLLGDFVFLGEIGYFFLYFFGYIEFLKVMEDIIWCFFYYGDYFFFFFMVIDFLWDIYDDFFFSCLGVIIFFGEIGDYFFFMVINGFFMGNICGLRNELCLCLIC